MCSLFVREESKDSSQFRLKPSSKFHFNFFLFLNNKSLYPCSDLYYSLFNTYSRRTQKSINVCEVHALLRVQPVLCHNLSACIN